MCKYCDFKEYEVGELHSIKIMSNKTNGLYSRYDFYSNDKARKDSFRKYFLEMSKYNTQGDDFVCIEINYCPFCGRKLTNPRNDFFKFLKFIEREQKDNGKADNN